MNDADIFFGPKPPTEMPPAKTSHFGRFPEMEELCNVFLSEMGWNPDPYTVQQVAAGGRDFVLAIGNEPKLLLHTIKKMKLTGLNISSPRSCITLARRSTPDADSDEARQRYVWEVDDE